MGILFNINLGAACEYCFLEESHLRGCPANREEFSELRYSTETQPPTAPRKERPPVPACPDKSVEVHELGEFPMSCYRCHMHADS